MKIMIKTGFILFIIFFVTAGLSGQDEGMKTPEQTLNELLTLFKSYHREVDGKKINDAQKGQNEEIKTKIGKIFNFKIMIYGALKDQLAVMTEKQKNEFYTKFKELIELVAYPQGSYFYNNSKNTFKPVFYKDNKAYIASENYNIDKDININIAYIFQKIDGKWMLVDVEMREHSLIDSYRLQINRLVEKNGLLGLMEALSKKYDEMKK